MIEPKPIYREIPQYIREINPYVPGRQIDEIECEPGLRAVKLASNENPLGPSPLAVDAAMKALRTSNRYPDATGCHLRESLANRLKMAHDNIIVGSGSADLINLAASTFLSPGTSAVTSAGSFPFYYIAIRKTGAKLIAVPLKNFGFDLNAIADAIESETRLVLIANPNNPTGTMFDADAFTTFCARVPENVLIVLDEAYFEYVTARNYSCALEVVTSRENILVLRTFSKIYGLAGLRIGYGIGSVTVLDEMRKIHVPFSTSGVAQAAALAALDDTEHVKTSIETNTLGLAQLESGLREMRLRFVPSVANFLLVRVGDNADAVAQELLKFGVIVRPMKWAGFPDAIRVTVGISLENNRFLGALAEVQASATSGKTIRTVADQEF